MVQSPIARGRVSHTILEDLVALSNALFRSLSKDTVIVEAEEAFAEYVGRFHCVAFPFARTALHAILRAKKLQRGDKVLLPPVTIKPILDVVLDLGLEPIFVDIDPTTLGFESQKLEEALKHRPKVALITYLFGLVPDCQDLVDRLKQENVFIIEDFSQCLNGSFAKKKIGTFGDVSIYSASSIKTFDTFGGGFAVLDDSVLADSLRRIQSQLDRPKRLDLVAKIIMSLVRNVATQRLIFTLFTWPLLRITKRRDEKKSPRFLGERGEEPIGSLPASWFRKYTSVQAQVALSQLPQVAGKDRLRVGKIERLDSLSNWSDCPSSHPQSAAVHWQHIVYADDPLKFIESMAKYGVDCTTTSLVQISNLPAYPYRSITPNGNRLFRTGVYLPCYHQMTEWEVERVARALNRISA